MLCRLSFPRKLPLPLPRIDELPRTVRERSQLQIDALYKPFRRLLRCTALVLRVLRRRNLCAQRRTTLYRRLCGQRALLPKLCR